MSQPADTPCTLIPCLRYRNAVAAINWLCRVSGFRRHTVHEDGAGGIDHAQLYFGHGMVMRGSARDVAPRQTDEAGDRHHPGLCVYVVVDDCRRHYHRVVAAGAEIVEAYSAKDHAAPATAAAAPTANWGASATTTPGPETQAGPVMPGMPAAASMPGAGQCTRKRLLPRSTSGSTASGSMVAERTGLLPGTMTSK